MQAYYTFLDEFIKDFVSPCILIFEDIDSFGESRETSNSQISDFLQFINGIEEREEKIIFIATTNYLNRLDKAISERPVRFNRKFEFKFPTKDELKQLVELYFNKDIAENFYDLYIKQQGKFSGAHVKELKRTADLLISKTKKKQEDIFKEALELVSKNFSITLKEEIGFNKNNGN